MMNQRESWQEQVNNMEISFQKAKTLGEEAAGLFSEYINLNEENEVLASHSQNWKEKRFEIVVVGEFSTGKSTFINALLQKEVLPSKVTPTTATINYIRHIDEGDDEEKAVIHFYNGDKKTVKFNELVDYVTEMSEKIRVVDQVSYVDLFVDSPYLKDGVVIVDTPGLQALHPEHERITKEQIKRSNASVLLFNMEQPGKRSEFSFLKDLSDSIDRIFFVGNRMDGVPEDELEEVVESLETALRTNEYQPIPEEQAKLFPISALQALKGKDPSVETMHWKNWTSQQLIKKSRFNDFEHRIEEYLFNGEKARDVIRTPIQAVNHYYEQLREKIGQIEVMISGEISVEQLRTERARLIEEVELRKLQLQEQQRNLKNLYQDVIHQHEGTFNERRENLLQIFIEQVVSIQLIEDLEEEASSIVIDINRKIQQLIDQSLQDLSDQVELTMQREISDFELKLEEDITDSINQIGMEQISVSIETKKRSFTEVTNEVEERFVLEAARLEEEKKLVQNKLKYQHELAMAKERQMLQSENQEAEVRFHDFLLNNTGAKIQVYSVIKERKIWFDKKGMVDVPNHEYERLVKEKKQIMKQQHTEQLDLQKDLEVLSNRIANSQSEFYDIQDYYEARRELQGKKDKERLNRIQEMSKAEERQLKREQKKIIREFETIFDTLRRNYRSLLRELDALKMAEKSIETYIEEKDFELNKKLQELETKEKLIKENTDKRETYKNNTKVILDKIKTEYESVTSLLIHTF